MAVVDREIDLAVGADLDLIANLELLVRGQVAADAGPDQRGGDGFLGDGRASVRRAENTAANGNDGQHEASSQSDQHPFDGQARARKVPPGPRGLRLLRCLRRLRRLRLFGCLDASLVSGSFSCNFRVDGRGLNECRGARAGGRSCLLRLDDCLVGGSGFGCPLVESLDRSFVDIGRVERSGGRGRDGRWGRVLRRGLRHLGRGGRPLGRQIERITSFAAVESRLRRRERPGRRPGRRSGRSGRGR